MIECKMTQKILQVACPQLDDNNPVLTNTYMHLPLLMSILRDCQPINVTSLPVFLEFTDTDKETKIDEDFGALMYIVTVLLMYSCGIFFMIMKNLTKEKQALEEERTLDDFFLGIPASENEREKVNINRVAIQAFYKKTSCKSQNTANNKERDQKKFSFSRLCYSVDTILEDEDEALEDYDSEADSSSDTEISEVCSKSQDVLETTILLA